ncbi:MAG: nitrous oxide reductase accessory protein NosL [Syntrophales bacterium]|nr:nitrous oxide reductase accessory protein NosL [Syntrophales bacterium]
MRKESLFFVPLILFLFQTMAVAGGGQLPQPSSMDKCPVCGMFVAKYPDWICSVAFRNGTTTFFDGPKDMFKYLADLKKYASARRMEDVEKIMVSDYYTVKPVNARAVFYVEGSDVYGPMGRELIPLMSASDAQEFMKDHRGRRILRFTEITREVLKALDQ